MSGYVTGWVLKNSEVAGAARMVLIVLADHASSDGTNAWPSIETIQLEARVSRSSVLRSLRELADAGSIRREGTTGKGQTNWTVLMGVPQWDGSQGGTGPTVTPGGVSSDAAGGSHSDTQTVLVNRPVEPSSIAPAENEVDVPVQRRLIDGEPVPLLSPVAEVDSVWDHYVEVMHPRSKTLDPATRKLIGDALKVGTHAEWKRAIDGCAASDVHMGRRGIDDSPPKKYNRPSHIFKGKRGIRTTREQLDLFLDIAEKRGVEGGNASVDPAMLREAKRNMLAAWEFPGSEQAKKAGEMSAAWLAQHGYHVGRDPETGRPTFSQVIE